MSSYFDSKDKKIRILKKNSEFRRRSLAFFLRNNSLTYALKSKARLVFFRELKNVSRYSVSYRNRCLLTSRSGSVFRYFRLSRISLKDLASKGKLVGVRRSSW